MLGYGAKMGGAISMHRPRHQPSAMTFSFSNLFVSKQIILNTLDTLFKRTYDTKEGNLFL
jgi:hypothetical protein